MAPRMAYVCMAACAAVATATVLSSMYLQMQTLTVLREHPHESHTSLSLMRSGGSPGTRGGAQAAQQKEMHEAALATADTVNAAPPHPLLMDTPGGVPQEVVDDNKLKKDLVAARSELEALRAEMARMGADPVNRRAAAPVGNVGGAAPGGSGVGGPSMPTRTYSDVDVVIMYANGTEPVHAQARVDAGGPAIGNARDRDNEELRFAVRSIERNMPWQTGGKVILYTDTPPLWLNWDHPRVRVVLHTEVYPKEEQADVLPTFNSDSILSTMANIPGLPTYFIKFDDDNMVGRMTTREDFVTEAGQPMLYFERHMFRGDKSGKEDEERVEKLRKSGQTWLGKMYHTRLVFTRKMPHFQTPEGLAKVPDDLFRFSKHAPVVIRTAMLQEIYEKWAPEFKRARQDKFRTIHGVDVHALWNWYCRLTPMSDGSGRPSCSTWEQGKMDHDARLVILSTKDTNTQLKCMFNLGGILADPPIFFTINDGLGRDPNVELANFAYRKLLPAFFPVPSEFETYDIDYRATEKKK